MDWIDVHEFQQYSTRTFRISSLEEFPNFRFKMLRCLVCGSRFHFFLFSGAVFFNQIDSHLMDNINRPLQFNIWNNRCFNCCCNGFKRFWNLKFRFFLFSAVIDNMMSISLHFNAKYLPHFMHSTWEIVCNVTT